VHERGRVHLHTQFRDGQVSPKLTTLCQSDRDIACDELNGGRFHSPLRDGEQRVLACEDGKHVNSDRENAEVQCINGTLYTRNTDGTALQAECVPDEVTPPTGESKKEEEFVYM